MGRAVTPVDPEGTVEVRGATWRARTNRATPIATGEPMRVVAIDGVTLEVEPESGGAEDYRERARRRRGSAGTDRSEAPPAVADAP
jgi:membrane-bound serine protease (ClpP class)